MAWRKWGLNNNKHKQVAERETTEFFPHDIYNGMG